MPHISYLSTNFFCCQQRDYSVLLLGGFMLYLQLKGFAGRLFMSPKLPHITAFDLMRALKSDGWYVVRQRGSHVILKHPVKPGRVTVPMHTHETLKPKTLTTIL